MAENEKSFTAEEVNKIVAERLSRQKRNDDALDELKAVLLELKNEGKLTAGSVAQLARELAETAPQNNDAAQSEAVSMQETEIGTAAPATETAKNGEAEKAAEKAAAEEKFAGEIAELSDVHPELDVNSLINDTEFDKFYSALIKDVPDASLLTAYEAYTEARAIGKRVEAASSMKRTPVMQSARSDYGQSLTERQRNIAKHAGMSYREYAELLAEIPKRKLR